MIMNVSKVYGKLKRNINNEFALGLFFYKIKHKVLLFFWKKCPKKTIKKINYVSCNEISLEKFKINISETFSYYNIGNLNNLTKQEIDSIILSANNSESNLYELLGSPPTYLNPINWHIDFKSGYIWKPNLFYTQYVQESITSNSDVKVPRELSRCHHFLHLSLAFRVSENKKYAKKITEQIGNWIDENPMMFSINWGCTMDVAIRSTNWIYALNLIGQFWSIDEAFTAKIKNSLYQHGWFIYRNLEKEQYNNHNHYLADIAGQIHLGLLFRDTKEGEKWLDEGIKELFKEIRYQILPSGMSYERSTNYNRLVLELILTPTLILKHNGYEIPQDIWHRIEKMFDFLSYTLKPNGHSPVIGDQDNGRLLPFGVEEQTDYSYLLSLGAILFNRSDLKYLSKGYNIYCVLLGGENSFEKFNSLKSEEIELTSKGFSDIGLYTMRKNNNYLIFNSTGKGMNPDINPFSGTHTHSDHLSFELVANGKTFLVDPGSFVYTADASERLKFRSTEMHNTVCIDQISQDNLQINQLWDFERNAIPKVLNWESNVDYDKIVALHNGYERLSNPITHFREVYFDKQSIKWEIKDYFKGTGQHNYQSFFHFDSGIDFEIIGNMINTSCTDNNNIQIKFISNIPFQLYKLDSFVSKSYGIKVASKSLKLEYSGTILPEIKTEITVI
jgi:uncharacterized heparinase superfamily protein